MKCFKKGSLKKALRNWLNFMIAESKCIMFSEKQILFIVNRFCLELKVGNPKCIKLNFIRTIVINCVYQTFMLGNFVLNIFHCIFMFCICDLIYLWFLLILGIYPKMSSFSLKKAYIWQCCTYCIWFAHCDDWYQRFWVFSFYL